MEAAHLVERIESVHVADAGVGQIATLIGDLGRMKGWIARTEAAAAHRAGQLEAAGQASSATDLLSRGTKTSRSSAEKTQRRGDALANTPGIEKQLGDGRISTEHADALASAAGKLDDEQRQALFDRDEELAGKAAGQTPSQFARTLARAVQEITADDGIERSEQQRKEATLSHGINADTGMGWIRADLHPDDYQKVETRLDAEIKAMKRIAEYEGLSYGQLASIALVGLVTGGRLKAQPPAVVSVMIDFETMVNGIHADTVSEYADGAPVPPETVRRHACNANIIPIVLGSDGMPLDVGRGARHATPA
ncbi:MAG: hypothetical protein WA964_12425, partial [Ilumatobacter sp.]|uniref:DUF222 domain-containing protein n=1 Tax=Ilumatobacter sp. TaxID=1967498 RepID=UPI003C796663